MSHLPMQETRVPFLVREDPAYLRATKPVCHSYWACALEPTSSAYWSLCPLEPVLCSKRSHCSEKPVHWNKDPAQPKINKCNFFFKHELCKGQGGMDHTCPQMTTISLSGFILEFMLLLLQSWPYYSVGHSLTPNTSEPLLVDQAFKPQLASSLTINVSIHSPCLIGSVFLILIAINPLQFLVSTSSLLLSPLLFVLSTIKLQQEKHWRVYSIVHKIES